MLEFLDDAVDLFNRIGDRRSFVRCLFVMPLFLVSYLTLPFLARSLFAWRLFVRPLFMRVPVLGMFRGRLG